MRRKIRSAAQLLLSCAALLLNGCASYTINAAKDVTAAGDKLAAVVHAADQARVDSNNALKSVAIAEGSGCQINLASIYVRNMLKDSQHSLAPSFLNGHDGTVSILTAVNGGKLPEGCQRLQTCEQKPHTPGCDSTCYSQDEAICLNQLHQLSRQKDIVAQGQKLSWEQSDLDYNNRQLSMIQYPEDQAIKSQAEVDALKIFSAYLDLLKKAATPQPTAFNRVLDAAGADLKSSITDDANNLAKKAESLRSKYNKVANYITVLPKAAGVSDANLTKETSAIGVLANDLNEIAQQHGEAKAIAQVVAAHQQEINQALKEIGDDIAQGMLQAYTRQNLANIDIRNAYQAHFNRNLDLITREHILQEQMKYPLPKPADLEKVIKHAELDAVIAQIQKTQATLVRILNDPSNEDLRKELSAGIDTLKQLIEDTADVAAAFK